MKGKIASIAAVVFLMSASAAWAQNPPGGQPPTGGQEGGIKTPDMDPYANGNKGGMTPAKELPAVASAASRVWKSVKSHSAKYSYHFVDMGAGKDERYSGTYQAKKLKSKMNMMWEAIQAPASARRQVVGSKILHLYQKDKTYNRIDYGRMKKDKEWPAELFFANQFNPSTLKSTFKIELKSLAGDYKKSTAKGGKDKKGPTNDPFADKAKDFEGNADQPKTGKGPTSGPNPQHHHVFVLTPKDKKLAANLSSAVLYVHHKTFVITKLVIKHKADGSKMIEVSLSDVKIDPEVADDAVKPVTDGYAEKK